MPLTVLGKGTCGSERLTKAVSWGAAMTVTTVVLEPDAGVGHNVIAMANAHVLGAVLSVSHVLAFTLHNSPVK